MKRLHDWLGRHEPDLVNSHWEGADFVTRCRTCGRAMIKPPGEPWRLFQAH